MFSQWTDKNFTPISQRVEPLGNNAPTVKIIYKFVPHTLTHCPIKMVHQGRISLPRFLLLPHLHLGAVSCSPCGPNTINPRRRAGTHALDPAACRATGGGRVLELGRLGRAAPGTWGPVTTAGGGGGGGGKKLVREGLRHWNVWGWGSLIRARRRTLEGSCGRRAYVPRKRVSWDLILSRLDLGSRIVLALSLPDYWMAALDFKPVAAPGTMHA